MRDKITRLERRILLAEAIVVLSIFIYLFFSAAPLARYPIAGQTIFDPDFAFEIEEGDEVIISTNLEFTNTIILKQGSDIQLPPGTYYWKAKNWLRESKVQTFTIQSNVGLDLYKRGENYELGNSGNVDLEVTKKKESITTNIPLEVGETKEVKGDNSSYEGKQNG